MKFFVGILITLGSLFSAGLIFVGCGVAYFALEGIVDYVFFAFFITLFYGMLGLAISEDRRMTKRWGDSLRGNTICLVVLHTTYVLLMGSMIAGAFR